jgi:hypothetical protein
MPATYESIATTTLGSDTAQINFTSISTAYTDLLFVASFKTGQAAPFKMWVGNGSIDTGSNYSNTNLIGDGSTASSSRVSNQAYFNAGYVNDTVQSILMVHFMNYSNTTTNKTALFRASFPSSSSQASFSQVGLWRSTSAINYIRIETNQPTLPQVFSSGSTFTLYGIKAA